MYTETRKFSKIPYADQTINPDAVRQIAFTKLFLIPTLPSEMVQSLRANP